MGPDAANEGAHSLARRSAGYTEPLVWPELKSARSEERMRQKRGEVLPRFRSGGRCR